QVRRKFVLISNSSAVFVLTGATGGLTPTTETSLNTVLRYSIAVAAPPAITYTYVFGGYLPDWCFVDANFTSTCRAFGARAQGVQRPYFICGSSDSTNTPRNLLDNNQLNPADVCRSHISVPNTNTNSPCVLQRPCFALVLSGSESNFCMV